MMAIEFHEDGIQIDAGMLGEGLGLEPGSVPDLLRQGAITSRCERGIAGDEGRYRISFFHEGRRFRLVIDDAGRVLRRSTIDFGDQKLPASLHKPDP
jgi:hypothetical protein